MNRILLITFLTTLVAAFSEDMLKGVQTGAFIVDEENLKVYQCAEVKLPPQAETFINMIQPMEMAFIQFTNMLTGETDKTMPESCEHCKDSIRRIATVYFLFMGNYEGTDFC